MISACVAGCPSDLWIHGMTSAGPYPLIPLLSSMRYPIAVVTRPRMSVYISDSTPSHGDCTLTKASMTLLRVARPPVVAPRPGGVTSSQEVTYIAVSLASHGFDGDDDAGTLEDFVCGGKCV